MQSLQQELAACCQEFQVKREGHRLSITAIFCFPPSFPGFDGHFPGVPVLPGIIQLAAIRHLAEVALQRPLFPAGYERTKFRGMISPDEQIHTALHLESTEEHWRGRFSIKRLNDEPVASGNCTFSQGY